MCFLQPEVCITEIKLEQHAKIIDWLEKVSSETLLKGGQRKYDLLSYIVRQELAGRGDNLKAYAIALDVLGRGEDFDPATDSIVRVEMARLRDALELYYACSEDPNEPKITIPKGSYRPSITFIDVPPEAEPASVANNRKVLWSALAATFFGLVIAVGWAAWSGDDSTEQRDGIPILMSTPDVEHLPVASADILRSLTSALRQSLSKRTTLTVLTSIPENSRRAHEYELVLRAVGIPAPDRISVELVDAKTSRIAWADAYRLGDGQPLEMLDVMAARVSDDLFPRIISGTKASLDRKPLDELNPWELYLLSTWVPGSELSTLEWELTRRDFAKRAVMLDPQLGQAHSVLADKLAYLSSVDADHHSESTVAAARYHAAQALQFASRDTNTFFNLGLHHWHLGEATEAVQMLERLVKMDPNNGFAAFFKGIWPYACDIAPDDVVKSAYDFDTQLGADNPIRWVTLTTLGLLLMNRGEFELALAAEQEAHAIFHSPDSVMRHAAILQALGRTNDAVQLIRDEQSTWPNFTPVHFDDVTVPRRCQNASEPDAILELYSDLAAAYQQTAAD